MKEEHQESVGFLCRWGALGLAWACAAAAVYMAVASASPHGGPPRVILTDAAFRPSHECYLKGVLLPPPGDLRSVRLLMRYPGRLQDFGLRENPPFYLTLKDPRPGDHPCTVTGVPYVFLIFGGDSAVLRVLRPEVRVCLVDGGLAERSWSGGPETWHGLLKAARRLGELVFLHPGPPEAFETFRRDLRGRGISEPVFCSLEGTDGAVASLYGQRGALMQGGQASAVALVTDNEPLAGKAAEWGLLAHYVAPPGRRAVRGRDRFQAHEGLEGLLRDLEAQAGGSR